MKTLPCLAATVLLAACATPYQYAQLDGRRYHVTPIDTYPVLILDVDGRSVNSNPVQVDPGRRMVRVQAPPGGAGLRETRTVALDVRACTRYYLVAVKDNRLASDFEVRVEHEEPVGGCSVKVAQR
ncbi:hypothetical protein [uncultured Methylibium sp.]|uniref:hypothetical protein n=1 Tax=uncultured Methylibium sp. TaxID=381093 RepID=UPI0025DCF74F|nr:hypothetical protein [uncultured Methylibium sp.]